MITDRQRSFAYEYGRFYVTLLTGMRRLNRNPELTLNLGVYFEQVPSGHVIPYQVSTLSYPYLQPDLTMPSFTTGAWPAGEWIRFKNTIIRESQRFWDSRFWLIPPASTNALCELRNEEPTSFNTAANAAWPARAQTPVAGMPQRHLYSFNITCRTSIYEATSAAHAHLRIRAPYLPTGLQDNNRFLHSTDSGRGWYGSGILTPHAVTANLGLNRFPFQQRQYLHEIGHALGQRHIAYLMNDRMCIEVPQHDPRATNGHCYTGYSQGSAGNIMGLGNQLSNLNARPWQAAAAALTNTAVASWDVSLSPVFPRYIGLSRAGSF